MEYGVGGRGEEEEEEKEELEFQDDVAISDQCCHSTRLTMSPLDTNRESKVGAECAWSGNVGDESMFIRGSK